MTRAIWKHVLLEYTIDVVAVDPIVRFVGVDPASGCPAVWIEQTTDDGGPRGERLQLAAVATGDRIKANWAYLGTVIIDDLVWHIHAIN